MFQITFQNNEKFDGGTLNNSKWNEIPDFPIRKLEYQLGSKKIILEDYEAYNHIVEHCAIFGGNTFISSVFVMAKKCGVVEVHEFNFAKKKYSKYIENFGEEYKKKPTIGWKRGIE